MRKKANTRRFLCKGAVKVIISKDGLTLPAREHFDHNGYNPVWPPVHTSECVLGERWLTFISPNDPDNPSKQESIPGAIRLIDQLGGTAPNLLELNSAFQQGATEAAITAFGSYLRSSVCILAPATHFHSQCGQIKLCSFFHHAFGSSHSSWAFYPIGEDVPTPRSCLVPMFFQPESHLLEQEAIVA